MADDAELYRDTELWTGMPVHEETEAQKAERLKREAKERKEQRLKKAKTKAFAFLKKTANLFYAALITTIVGWLFYLLIGFKGT